MSSTTFRCAFCRLHRNPDSPARPCHCHSGLDGLTESEIYSAIGTPAPTRGLSMKKTPTRRRQQSESPDSDNDSTAAASSPLQNRSTNLGTALATASGLISPSQSQEPGQQATTVNGGPNNVHVIRSHNHTPESETSPQQILSPASTQIVHETPLPHPRSRSVSIQTDSAIQRNLSPASTQIVPETPLPQPRSLGINIQANLANHIEAMDIAHLRRSRNQAVTELDERTAQVDRLITRGRILEAEKIAQQGIIAQTRIELIQARLKAVESEQRTQWKYVVALIVLILVIGIYALWCAHNSEDFVYADRVRKDFLNGR